MTAPQTIDPFAGGTSTLSVSWKDAPVGTTVEGVIIESPELVQSRDFDTDEPAFWPGVNGQPGNPKMAAVIKLSIDGEERAVWAVKPSAMFAAIADAIKKAGSGLAVGGTLAIRYTGDKPNANPRLNAAKQFAARYTPPSAPPAADPFASTPAAAAAPAGAKDVRIAALQDDNGWDAAPPF